MYQLGCLDTPTAGSVRLAGHDIAELTDSELAALRNQFVGFRLPVVQSSSANDLRRQRRASTSLCGRGSP